MSVQAININARSRFDDLKKQVYFMERALHLANNAIETIECQIDPEELNSDQLLEYYTFRRLADSLVEIEWEIRHMRKPVVATGRLYKNDQGRWAINDHIYFTCGSMIEVYIQSTPNNWRWVRTSVEGNDGEYFLVGYSSVNMDGLLARVRG